MQPSSLVVGNSVHRANMCHNDMPAAVHTGVAGPPDEEGYVMYQRPEGKSGGHGVGWSEIPRYKFKAGPQNPVSLCARSCQSRHSSQVSPEACTVLRLCAPCQCADSVRSRLIHRVGHPHTVYLLVMMRSHPACIRVSVQTLLLLGGGKCPTNRPITYLTVSPTFTPARSYIDTVSFPLTTLLLCLHSGAGQLEGDASVDRRPRWH